MSFTMKCVAVSATCVSLIGCGSDQTRFGEVATGSYNVRVEDGQTETTESPGVEAIEGDAPSSDATSGNEMGDGESDDAPSSHDDSTNDGDTQDTDSALTQSCKRQFSGQARYIRVISSQHSDPNIQINKDTVLAFRLSGNQPKVDLKIAGIEAIAGICVMATGNQPKLNIESSVNIRRLVYSASGNQSQGIITLKDEAQIEASSITLKGHQNSLKLVGAADSHCANAIIKGNSSTCE